MLVHDDDVSEGKEGRLDCILFDETVNEPTGDRTLLLIDE